MRKPIPVAGPWITQKEIDYVTDAVTNAWYENANLYHERFESAFAGHVGVPYAMALPSCTSGIHLALSALGIGPGDEVIVPEITWIATAAPVTYVGAVPVFVDVDPVTWCISPDSAEAAITSRTKAIISVDLYGNMADYERLGAVVQKHGVSLIEDAAEAVGATYKLRPAGSFGDAAVLSFHGSKTLTTGEGGMLLTHDKALYDRASFLRDHGRVPGDFSFQNREVAFKYKMSSMQAALGLAQLERLDELIHRKRLVFEWYRRELEGIPGTSINRPGPDVAGAYWMIALTWDKSHQVSKKDLSLILAAKGIDTRPFFSPLSSLKAYQDKTSAAKVSTINPVSYGLADRGINLPSSLSITEEQVHYVCQEVLGAFKLLSL